RSRVAKVRERCFPLQGPKVYLAGLGDANDPRTFSGIACHFLQTAKRMDVVSEGLPLCISPRLWRLRRWMWNLAGVARGDRPGGFQYSEAFLEPLWQPVRHQLGGSVVLNCFQLFPPSIVHDPSIRKWFFLDQTLVQLFDAYGERRRIGRRIAGAALAREQEAY